MLTYHWRLVWLDSMYVIFNYLEKQQGCGYWLWLCLCQIPILRVPTRTPFLPPLLYIIEELRVASGVQGDLVLTALIT